MTTKLKPCPFCGHYAYVTYWGKVMCAVDSENRDYFTVFCSNCDANIGAESEDEVVKRWNNRIPTPKKMCANCKHWKKEIDGWGSCDCNLDNHNEPLYTLFEDFGISVNGEPGNNCDKWESEE